MFATIMSVNVFAADVSEEYLLENEWQAVYEAIEVEEMVYQEIERIAPIEFNIGEYLQWQIISEPIEVEEMLSQELELSVPFSLTTVP